MEPVLTLPAAPGLRPSLPDHHLTSGWHLETIAELIDQLTAVHTDQESVEVELSGPLSLVPDCRRGSARNLLHYLALRGRDIRHLQESLADLGLSSLGRAEGHVQYNIQVLLKHLNHLIRHTWQVPTGIQPAISPTEAHRLLERRAETLLGAKPHSRAVRIMVTMPTEAAHDGALIEHLLEAGMNSMRINCAHDGPEIWAGMIAHLERAKKESGKPCSILMDLAGPKIRTGPMKPGSKVLKWKPERDEFGRVRTPAHVWLTASENPAAPPEPAAAVLPVRGAWLAELEAGDRIKFRDARNAKRTLIVTAAMGAGCWVSSEETCYVEPGTPLHRSSSRGPSKSPSEPVGDLPALELGLTLKKGDRLLLTRSQEPGVQAIRDNAGRTVTPARISCTLTEALDGVKKGEPVRFDDGKISGVALESTADGVLIEITRAAEKGSKLGADKGINFPASDLPVPSLTAKDREDLRFVACHADMVGYSFVRTARDVRDLGRALAELGGSHVGVVLKIETQAAVSNLPALLLSALEAPAAGIMIARGDLAIECGYERLAELQEEILWLSEAAHLPVIWATQVLEHLTKDGQPSRAEVTDAAMGERAECVMLNKGPYVVEAVRTLDDIIRRMETHQSKKTALLRPLKVAAFPRGE